MDIPNDIFPHLRQGVKMRDKVGSFYLDVLDIVKSLYICHIVVLQDFRRYEVLCVLPLKSVHGEGIVGYKYEYVQEL